MRCSTRDGKLQAWQSFEDGKPVAIRVSKNLVTQLLCVAYPLQNSTGSTYMNQSVQISISSALRFVVYLLSWHAVYGGKTFSHWLLCRRDKKLIQFCVLQHRQCRSLWLLPVLISSHCHCTARSAMNVKMNISVVNSKKQITIIKEGECMINFALVIVILMMLNPSRAAILGRSFEIRESIGFWLTYFKSYCVTEAQHLFT